MSITILFNPPGGPAVILSIESCSPVYKNLSVL